MIVTRCDGCGKLLDNGAEVHVHGFVKTVQYCAGCDVKAVEYRAALDAAHTAAALAWVDAAAAVREKYGAELKALPDV